MATNSGTKLGDAYVQVHASMQGVTKELTGGMDTAGKESGNAFGASFGAMVKKLAGLAVVAETGRKLGETFAASFAGAADYEQLEGGVETLFGAGGKSVQQYAKSVGKSVKDAKAEYKNLMSAQKDVLENASEAWNTAGMSANDYIENVNGFAASMVASLGGNTKKAAQAADQAMIDMADNANKMGTPLERITDAYQSFARGQYGLLDNLKLGYGGTKTEMERLLADAEKLTGKKYSIENFADITKAIHAIQEEMGITGTTVEEGSSTVSGSIGRLQAAWSNLLTGMGADGANIDKLVGDVVGSFEDAAANIIPMAANVVGGMMTALPQVIEGIGPTIAEKLPEIAKSIEEQASSMVDAGAKLMGELGRGIAENLPDLASKALEIASGMSASIREKAGTLVDAGLELIQNLAQGIADSLPALIENVPTIVENIAETINENVPKMLKAALNIIKTLGSGLVRAIPVLVANIPKIIKAAVSAFTAFSWAGVGKKIITSLGNGIKSMVGAIKSKATEIGNAIKKPFIGMKDKLREIGGNIIDGLWNGVKSAFNGFTSKFSGLIDLLPAAAKKILGIASPSKVFKKIGGFVSEGFALGIEGKSEMAVKAALGLGSGVIGAMGGRSAIPAMAFTASAGAYSPASRGDTYITLDYSAGADANQMVRDIGLAVKRMKALGV